MIANQWNFNICFHVWGSFHLVFAVRAPKKWCDYFWPIFWPENAFSPFSYTGGLLVCKNKKMNCFDIQCVVESSSFRLYHNMTLESKENYPRHTKTVQNSLAFMPEVKPLLKPHGDLVLGCCRISIYRKLSILKIYRIFTFTVGQIWKYQNSDIIDGGKNVEVFEPKQSSKTRQICLTYLI